MSGGGMRAQLVDIYHSRSMNSSVVERGCTAQRIFWRQWGLMLNDF